jgi:UDP-N-acetylglucosamine:LPS N-acetylglucosamine transferase
MTENILLYFSDTGRGHRSATEAVQEALQMVATKEYNGLELKLLAEPVAEKSHALNRYFVALYNYLLGRHQYLMKYYYALLHVLKPNESEFGYKLVREYLCKQMIEMKPGVVVSMHPMTNHYIQRAMKEVGLTGDVKMLVVITDPNKNLWRGWACKAADLIIAPNELVKDRLMEWGILESRIMVSGMPVNPDFLAPPTVERAQFLSHLGLSPELPTLCINSGWAGGGNMLAAYKALSHVQENFQVIFLCGQNRDLYEKAKELAAESNIPTAVLPFHDKMPDLMNAVDAMVTKAGGLTSYECIAKRLPMIIDVITPPMPQEEGTVEILVETGLARRLRSPEELAKLVRGLTHDPKRAEKPLPAKYCLNNTEAVFEIAKTILQNSAHVIQNDEKKQDHSGFGRNKE